MKKHFLAGATLLLGMAGGLAQAAPTDYRVFNLGQGENDCQGFNTCYAYQWGTLQSATPPTNVTLPSLAVHKIEEGGGTETGSSWPTISGVEFTAASGPGNTLDLTYTPEQGVDPTIFYISIKQASQFALLYFEDGFRGTETFNLSTYFTNPGWSHVIFFNGGPDDGGGGGGGVVPTPASLLLFGAGLLGLGAVRRRQKA